MVEYRLRVSRTGAESDTLIVTDALPVGTTFVDGSITGTIQNQTAGSQVRVTSMLLTQVETPDGQMRTGVEWKIEGLREGETAYLTFRVYAPLVTDNPNTPVYEYKTVFTNTGLLVDTGISELVYEETTGTNKKGQPVYDRSTARKVTETTYHEVRESVLESVKSSNPVSGTQVKEGDTITYTIAVTNKGAMAAKNVIVRDAVPTGTTLVEGSGKSSVAGVDTNKTQVGGRPGLLWVIPELNPGATVTVSFTVTVDAMQQAGTKSIENAAQVKEAAAGEDPKNPSETGFTSTNTVTHTQTMTYATVFPSFPKTGDVNGLPVQMFVTFGAGTVALCSLLVLLILKKKREDEKRVYENYLKSKGK